MAGIGTLFGRDAALTELGRQATAARRGRGGLVLVAGDAGIGKTALVNASLTGRLPLVLRGVTRSSAAAPFEPLVTAIRSHPRWPGIAGEVEAAGGFVEAERDALASLFGEFTPSRAVAAGAAGDGAPSITRSAIGRLLVALARLDPLIVVLDDLQRTDLATLDVLADLAGTALRERLLVVAMYRTDELPRSSPVRRLRVELRRAGRLHEIVLDALDPAATYELATRALGAPPDAALAQRLVERSQGLPLFVEELAAALLADDAVRIADGVATLVRADLPIPETLRDSILVRLEGVSAAHREGLDLAALLGDEMDEGLVDALAGSREDWRGTGLDRGILVASGAGRVAFRHGLVREVLVDDQPASDRRSRHARIAGALQERGSAPLTIAEHWLRAGRSDLAVDRLVDAGEAFCLVHAYRDAARAFQRALDEDPAANEPRTDVVERLASSLELAGDLAEASRRWQSAATARAAHGLPGAAAADLRRRAGALEVLGRWQRAIETRLAAAAAFEGAGLRGEAGTERLAAAAHLRSAASFTAALDLLELAGADARAAGRLDLETRVIGLRGNVLARLGRADEGLPLVREGLTLALDAGLTAAAAELFQRLADSLEHAGRYDPARAAYLEGADYCRTRSIEPTAQLCLACMSVVLWQTGRWSEAERTAREVRSSHDATLHARAVADGIAGIVCALRGGVDRARPLLQSALSTARRIELAAMELTAMWGLALCDRTDGDMAGSIERCGRILERWRQTEERHYVVPALRWSAGVYAEAGDGAGVRACADALARIAAETAQPEAIAALAAALGDAAALDGDHLASAAHLASALAAIADRDLPFDRAEIGRHAGVALVRAGRRDEGVAELVAAARTARRIGATPLGMAIANDLAALGEQVDRRLGSREARRLGDHGLTRRELEVLQHVARGQTSREIAHLLFLSPRTIEMHVGSALLKLDCRTRAEAIRRLSDLGLLETAIEPVPGAR